MERRLLTLAFLGLAACWQEEPLIHGAFTAEQWAHLQADFAPRPGELPTCDGLCMERAKFGQQLFFETRLSGPWIPVELGPMDSYSYPTGKVACVTCHDAGTPLNPGWFADTRSENATSMGAEKRTGRNTISLINVDVGHRALYTWSGNCSKDMPLPCTSPTDVMQYIALPNAMSSKAAMIGALIRNDKAYRDAWFRVFGPAERINDDAAVQADVETALDAYLRQLVSVDSKFDRFIAGDDSALDVAATRGFALFVGRAMCIECHSGWRFTDDKPRITGVYDAKGDKGDGTGAFFTPTLRNVDKTFPYMHNGTLNTLGEVIDFYHWGGRDSGFYGDDHKDPLMNPFPLEPGDAVDLEAFLRALTGSPVSGDLCQDTHPSGPPACKFAVGGREGLVCNGKCTEVMSDANHCGSCSPCNNGEVCMGGKCLPLQCPPPMQGCGSSCVNFQSDPANCGGCGYTCSTGQICTSGMCTASSTCPLPAQTMCATGCTDLQTDLANCGACGTTCPGIASCQSGTCQPLMCMPPTMACNSACVNVMTDPLNCNGCGNVCPANKPNCVAGVCKQ